MPKGGARARSGPPPDPNALRRDRDAGEWKILPAAGRPGDPPDWPLLEQTDREAVLWADLWTRPQAVVWEAQRQDLEVALYVRRLAEAEVADSSVALSTLVRQMADSLGLTTPGLRSNRWRIDAAPAEATAAKPKAAPARARARDRLRVVGGSG